MKKNLGPNDIAVQCGHCQTPYAWESNILTGEHLWVRRCKSACRRKHPEQKPEAVGQKEDG